MKKFLLVVLALSIFGQRQTISASYQGLQADTTIVKKAATDSTNKENSDNPSDVIFSYNKDAKAFGINIGADTGKFIHFRFGMNFGFGDSNPMSFLLGFGLQKRFTSENFLLQGMLYPYIGYSQYEYKVQDGTTKNGSPKMKDKKKREFTYGAAANICVGIKVYTSKKSGTRTFLAVGYYIAAPEFKTDNMFKNGSWCLGLTFIP